MAAGLPFTVARDRVRLAVRLTPKASADRIVGLIEDGRGGWALKATVTAPPVEGAANAALIQLLARHFGLKPRDLAITVGSQGRLKLVEVSGDPAMLVQLLTKGMSAWLTPS